MIARREFVATVASIVGTVLPFGVGGSGGSTPEGNRTDLTGVVDRIVGDVAVLLIERADAPAGERLVSVDRLPAAAREEGAVLALTLAGGDLERLRHDAAAERRRRAAAEDRFDALAEDGPR